MTPTKKIPGSIPRPRDLPGPSQISNFSHRTNARLPLFREYTECNLYMAKL